MRMQRGTTGIEADQGMTRRLTVGRRHSLKSPPLSTLFQILDSHRGLAIQLRDQGAVSRIHFSDVQLSTVHDRYSTWWGAAEPLYAVACARFPGASVGRVRDVLFERVAALSEGGSVFSGDVSGLRVVNSSLHLRSRTPWPWPGVDFRPGCRGLVAEPRSHAVLAEGPAVKVHMSDVRISYEHPYRSDWGVPLKRRARAFLGTEGVVISGWRAGGNEGVESAALCSDRGVVESA